jgi:hypothetical protein
MAPARARALACELWQPSMKNPLVAAYRYTSNTWSLVFESKVCGCCNRVQTTLIRPAQPKA